MTQQVFTTKNYRKIVKDKIDDYITFIILSIMGIFLVTGKVIFGALFLAPLLLIFLFLVGIPILFFTIVGILWLSLWVGLFSLLYLARR